MCTKSRHLLRLARNSVHPLVRAYERCSLEGHYLKSGVRLRSKRVAADLVELTQQQCKVMASCCQFLTDPEDSSLVRACPDGRKSQN